MNWTRNILPILSTLGWGAAFTFIPLALKSFCPLELMTIRFGLAGVLFAALFALGAIPAKAISLTDLPRFAGMTLSLVIIYNFALSTAQLHLPACFAILVGQAAPFLVIGFERIKHGSFQVARPSIAIGTWVSGTTLVIATYGREFTNQVPLAALAMLIVTPFAMAAYMILSRPLLQRYGSTNVCAQMFIVGGMCLTAMQCWKVEFWQHVATATSLSVLAVGGLVVISTMFAYTLWFAHIEKAGASSTALYLNLVPIFGFVFAAAVLREPVSIELLIGGVLTVAGCAASGIQRQRVDERE